jgi:hypothetical protein
MSYRQGALGPSRGSVDALGATLQNTAPACPPPLPMACIRYYGVVPRDAGSWVGCVGAEVHCPACNSPCMLARGRQSPCNEAQSRMLDVYRAWDARGAPSGRYVANDLAFEF